MASDLLLIASEEDLQAFSRCMLLVKLESVVQWPPRPRNRAGFADASCRCATAYVVANCHIGVAETEIAQYCIVDELTASTTPCAVRRRGSGRCCRRCAAWWQRSPPAASSGLIPATFLLKTSDMKHASCTLGFHRWRSNPHNIMYRHCGTAITPYSSRLNAQQS